jgi:hypothetical protein
MGGDRFPAAPEVAEHIAAAEPGAGKLRLERQGPVISGERFLGAPAFTQRVAAAEPGLGEVGIKRQRLAIGGGCFVMAMEPAIEDGLVQMRRRIARLEAQRCFDAGECGVVLIDPGKRGGALIERRDMPWLEPDERVELRKRLAASAELEQRKRVDIEEREAAAVDRKAAGAAIDRGFVVGGLKQDGSVVLDELDVGRRNRQRARHQQLGLREIAAAGLGDAEEVEGVKIVGIFVQQPPVKIGGLAEPAAAAQGVRGLQRPVILGFQHRKRPAPDRDFARESVAISASFAAAMGGTRGALRRERPRGRRTDTESPANAPSCTPAACIPRAPALGFGRGAPAPSGRATTR